MASRQINHLSCAVCLDWFKQPKILPCGHTFCLNPCLRNLEEDFSISCPVCRTSHDLFPNGVDALTDNFAMASLSEFAEQGGTVSQEDCQDCRNNTIEGGCVHCNRILCRNCFVKHSKMLSSQLSLDLSKVKSKFPNFEDRIAELKKHQSEIEDKGEKEIENLETKFAAIKGFYEDAEVKAGNFARNEGNMSSLKEKQKEMIAVQKRSKNFATETSFESGRVVSTAEKLPEFDDEKSRNVFGSISSFQGLKEGEQRKDAEYLSTGGATEQTKRTLKETSPINPEVKRLYGIDPVAIRKIGSTLRKRMLDTL